MQETHVYGQERAIRFLTNAISNKQISHAYLFSGKKGLGKDIIATRFAKSLLCERSSVFEECSCQACMKVDHDAHPDMRWVGRDETEKTIKLAEIRDIQAWLSFKPLEGSRKICIVYYAERMTEEAANAFLKTLEEPPANSFIIFIVEHTFQLLETILSRLVEVRFESLSCGRLAEILERDYGYGAESHFLAYQSQGSIGVARQFKENNFFDVKNSILDSFLTRDARDFFLDLVQTQTAELDALLHFLCGVLHDVLLLKYSVDAQYVINQDRIADLTALSERVSSENIQVFLTVCEDARRLLKRNVNTKLILTNLATESVRLNQ
jgi:DNA polymerase-3 subunit delta'